MVDPQQQILIDIKIPVERAPSDTATVRDLSVLDLADVTPDLFAEIPAGLADVAPGGSSDSLVTEAVPPPVRAEPNRRELRLPPPPPVDAVDADDPPLAVRVVERPRAPSPRPLVVPALRPTRGRLAPMHLAQPRAPVPRLPPPVPLPLMPNRPSTWGAGQWLVAIALLILTSAVTFAALWAATQSSAPAPW